MRCLRYGALGVAVLSLVGCLPPEKYEFTKASGQETIVRDGREAIISTKGTTTVVLKPLIGENNGSMTPVFVATIFNGGSKAIEFRQSGVTVTNAITGGALKVWTVEDVKQDAQMGALVSSAILGAATVGAGAAAAQSAGSVPLAAVTTTSIGAAGGVAIAGNLSDGQRMAQDASRSTLSIQTILPKEWYGGAFRFDGARPDGHRQSYLVRIVVGGEVHQFSVSNIGGMPG